MSTQEQKRRRLSDLAGKLVFSELTNDENREFKRLIEQVAQFDEWVAVLRTILECKSTK